jgi:MYXO-CTERM domain-containing protein
VWTSTTGAGTPGSSQIVAAPGDQLVGEIRVTPDAGGVGGYAVSLEFDTDLENELDLVSASETLPAGMDGNLSTGVVSPTQESTAGQVGRILSFEAVSLTAGPTSGTFVAGVVTFDVTANVANDGADVLTGGFNVDFDAVGDNANALVTPIYRSASVNASQPVPGLAPPILVALTLLLSLGALWALRRRHGVAQV